jgi:hypothetical protein
MKTTFTALLAAAFVVALPLAAPVFAGSTIGGQPGNGGGTTFGTPAASLVNIFGGEELARAIASGDPVQINTALLNAINAAFPGGIGSIDLSPLPGMTGAETVSLLTALIRDYAAAVGLALNSPSIVALLQIAATASA